MKPELTVLLTPNLINNNNIHNTTNPPLTSLATDEPIFTELVDDKPPQLILLPQPEVIVDRPFVNDVFCNLLSFYNDNFNKVVLAHIINENSFLQVNLDEIFQAKILPNAILRN